MKFSRHIVVILALAAAAAAAQVTCGVASEHLWQNLQNAATAAAKAPTDAAAAREVVARAQQLLLSQPPPPRQGEALELLLKHVEAAPLSEVDALELLRALPDAAPEKREQLEQPLVLAKWRAISLLEKDDLAAALRVEREYLQGLLERHPRGSLASMTYEAHLRRAAKRSLDDVEVTLHQFKESGGADVRAVTDAWERLLELRSTPLEFEFTAIDGRHVDMAKLRGKVVIVEFTGVTWCPACRIAEEQLKELYAKYRAQGLEIVAITYEFSPKDRDKVARLIEERGLPWPFHFDGLRHRSPLIQRFGIKGYPTALVLSRSGRLFAYNPHGPALEQAVIAALAHEK